MGSFGDKFLDSLPIISFGYRTVTFTKILTGVDMQCDANDGKKSEIETRSLTMLFERSSISLFAPQSFNPPPAKTQDMAFP